MPSAASTTADSPLYRQNLLNYALQAGVQAIPAIVLGIIIDKILKKFQECGGIHPLIMIVIQIIVIILILYLVEKHVAPNYASDWQITTPGILFPIFFLGVQFNLFDNIKRFKRDVFDEK